MGVSQGVDLEWAIVEFAKNKSLSKKYSSLIKNQAISAVRSLEQKVGRKYEIWHSDDKQGPFGSIYAKPEPKTDILIKVNSQLFTTSVKMEGGIQLASGEGRSTAELFRVAARSIGNTSKKQTINQLISNIEDMPTRLLSESNLNRILKEGSPQVIKEFIVGNKIRKEKDYEEWVKNKKPALIAGILKFVEKDDEFFSALIKEALTGKNTLASFKGAVANSILSPGGFYKIDDAYVRKIKPKIKMDIRAKSRSGITSIAFRIETRGSI